MIDLREIEVFWDTKETMLKKHYYQKNNRLHGPQRVYDRGGRLRIEANWREGFLEGFYRSWSKDGQLKEETFHKNGIGTRA